MAESASREKLDWEYSSALVPVPGLISAHSIHCMKTLLIGTAALLPISSFAQEPAKPAEPAQPGAPAAPATPAPAAPKEDAPEIPATELEAKFKATLTNATMSGRWCLIKDGQLTPEKPDKYTIVGVNKLFGERWIIRARIQYGEKD